MAARRPSIACVYCGGSHASAVEVRDCWQRSGGAEVVSSADDELPLFDEPAPAPPPRQEPAPTPPSGAKRPPVGTAARSAAPGGTVAADRGPLALGRHVIVDAGAPAPVAWADAPRVAVRLDEACVVELQHLAHRRQSAVLEVDAATAPEVLGPDATNRPPHELGPRFTLVREAVRHLVVSNAVDARRGNHFEPASLAVSLGAQPLSDGTGDVRLPDGTVVWLDGGPPRVTAPVAGVPVLHRVAMEHRSLRPPHGNDTGAELAPDQRAAVTHPDGAARIIAPAGSGKTRVLTERARHLLRQWNLPPSAVCLVAFNKRAQEEMVARTADLRGLQVRTLNAIALAIVNGSAPFAPRPSRVATVDEPEVRRLIGKLVSFPRRRNADPVATWIEALSAARLGLRSPADVESDYDGDVDGFAQVLPAYRAALARAGQVDYDEQIILAIELLLTQPGIREAAQRACRVLLVDEFQDLTPAHVLLVRLLAGPDAAVFGVGDDDQTIYGYNGADPAWLIDFEQLFPGAGQHPLEVNYRCPAGIVRAADTLLRHNSRRVPKVIRAAAGGDGFEVSPSDGESLTTTVDAIAAALSDGTPPGQMAVLTRVNSLLAPVQVALRAAGVPTTGGVGKEFLDRTAVRAALAWLRLSVAGDTLSSADVGEALRRPTRSLHPRVSDWVGEQTSVAGLRRLAGRVNEEKAAKVIDEFAADIEVLQRRAATRTPTALLLGTVFDQIGLAGNIAQLDGMRKGMNRSAQNDDVTALRQLALLQPDPVAFEPWLRESLSAGWQQGGVTLATVHRVKGQEWPFVVVHHAEADQFPHRLATDTEEERRLFHVAITRASRQVVVVHGDRPSPFILDCTTEPGPRRAAPPPSSDRPAKKAEPAARPGHALEGDSAARFAALRDWRRHAANGKPAYTVFSDATLEAIAVANPTSVDELARIKGVGPSKLQQYGDAVLRQLADA